MSNTYPLTRREAIRQTLAQRVHGAPDASAVADAALGLWHQMATRLEPVIGARGVDVLFGRALHLTSKAFPWLATAGVHGNSAASLASVRANFQACEVGVAAQAGSELLVAFTELLATLIGEPLTERLLGVVWAPAQPVSEPETAA